MATLVSNVLEEMLEACDTEIDNNVKDPVTIREFPNKYSQQCAGQVRCHVRSSVPKDQQ